MTDEQLDLDAIDPEEDPGLPPSEDTLTSLRRMAAEVIQINERLERYEQVAKELTARRNAILGKEMPDLMDGDGTVVEDITVDGRKFTLGNFVQASIKKDAPNKEEAYAWLEANEGADLVVRQVVVSMPSEFLQETEEAAQLIRERYQMATVTIERSVLWQRLTSWVREEWEVNGKTDLPLELLGATVGRVVRVKEPRASRKR